MPPSRGNTFEVRVTERALKELARIPEPYKGRILEGMRGLRQDPRPANSKALQGEYVPFRRLRVGDYRVVYDVLLKEKQIRVTKIGTRQSMPYA